MFVCMCMYVRERAGGGWGSVSILNLILTFNVHSLLV